MLLPIIIVADLIAIYSVVDVITTLLFLLLLAYIVRWQMLLPLYVVDGNHILFVCNAGRCYCLGGRWNNHPGVGFSLEDVISMVAYGITTGQLYFNFSSDMFNRTSSHMCGRWNLPTFLFRDGLLALMLITSLMVLRQVLVFPCQYTEICLQKANTHKPIPALGQPSCHSIQIQHDWDSVPQSQNHLLWTNSIAGRRRALI